LKDLRLVLRDGFVFGVIAGVFAVVVLVGALFIGREFPLSTFSSLTGTALSFLIMGAAGRKIATVTGNSRSGWQLGALAGGISELIRTVAISAILSYSSIGQAEFNRLSPAEQAGASDPATQIVNLAIYLGAAIIFGGLAGWLGAWSMLRFGPPQKPQA
jgi:energy-coupling factor transporter transmembrane protein EcfT